MYNADVNLMQRKAQKENFVQGIAIMLFTKNMVIIGIKKIGLK